MKPTHHIIMVRPASFRRNEQTSVNNFYQKSSALSATAALEQALAEFDTLVACLRNHNVQVTVIQDTLFPDTPDALFPNNWFALFPQNRAALFPMFAPNRRLERSHTVFHAIAEKGYPERIITDYSDSENATVFLEGTGSVVLDHQNKMAYCALSPRSDLNLFHTFCTDFEFKPISFHACQTFNNERKLIYHTNVMMAIGAEFAIVCLDAIDCYEERSLIHDALIFSGKEVIPITEEQVSQFAGNMLALSSVDDESLLVMSSRAYTSLSEIQIQKLEQYATLIHSPVPTIEDLGGGSVRCMLAEVY